MQDIKTPIVEGWLKKKKSEGSKNFFSKFTKRWFVLDTKNAIFTYTTGKGKSEQKAIPLREFMNVEEPTESGEKRPKGWEFEFIVVTQSRNFQLFAQTQEEKQLWIDAFQEILKLRNSDSEDDKKKKKKKDKKKKKKKELDIDSIVKKGPRETVQLEPPTPLEDFQHVDANIVSYGNSMADVDQEAQPFESVYNRQITKLQNFSIEPQKQQTKELRLEPLDTKPHRPSTEMSDGYTKSSSGNLKSNTGDNSHSRNSGPNEELDKRSKEVSFEEDWDEDEDYGSLNEIESSKMGKKSRKQKISNPHSELQGKHFMAVQSIGQVQY